MSGARSILSIGASIAVLTTAACSITVGFDGFVGPSERSGDGGVNDRDDGSVAVNPGGELDSAISDEPERPDGGEDADAPDPNTPPRFVDAGTFCAKQDGATTFCDDFDTQDLSAQWIREGLFSKLTSYSAKSAPNVFLVDVPPTSTGGTFASKISHDFETPSTSMIVEFDIKPEQVNPGSSFFMLAALEWGRNENKYSLRLVYSNGNVRLEESNLVAPPNNKDAYHPFFTLPINEWTRVTLDVVASGPNPGAKILLDGVAAGARETITPTPDIDQRPTLILGAVYAGNPHTGWTLRYDDVSVAFR